MLLYIPFIHKIVKKKEKENQLPLYIDLYVPLENQIDKSIDEENKTTIITIF